MKQKLFTFFFALVASVSAIYASYTEVDGIWYDFNDTDLTATVTHAGFDIFSSAYSGSVVIPETVTYNNTTYSVTRIGDYAFFACSSLTSVTIPNSVTSIGYLAFGSSAITEVTIPNSVTYIENEAFSFCESLTMLNLSNNLTVIKDYVFSSCSSLTSVVIPNSVTTIGFGAFGDCYSLMSITIPKSVINMSDNAFSWATSLTAIYCESDTPPVLEISGNDPFMGVDMGIPVYVPCGAVEAYKSSSWNMFSNIQEPLSGYSLAVYSQHEEKGMAIVDKNSVCGAQITATANYGYHFTQWNDGVTDNPRTFVITQDTTFTAEFAPNQYTITTTSADEEMGYTEGDTVANYLEYITLSAIANYGYHFVGWSDYTYENPRVVQVTEDMTYTAIFEKNLYNILLQSNNGTIESVTQAAYLDDVTMMAVADYGYHFTQWSDGVTDNPRTFVITQDTTFTAEFAQTYSGQCGDNLYWGYANDTLTITGYGAMYDERPWGLFVNEIQKIALPTGITHLGNDAFQDCIGLRDIDLPYTLETIGDYSFNGCRRLITINCYPLLPPIAESTSFSNYSANLYAPCDNLEEYKYDMVFGQFKYFECIGSESVTTDGTIVTPGSTDVTITWPTDENADTYTILIMKGEEIFCRLLFNTDGQLLNIAFAPSRSGSHPVTYAASTGNGLRFTVTSLDAATTYGYDITTKDEKDNTLSTYTGEFTTKSNVSTSVSDIQSPMTDCQKLIRDGQLFILRDGVEYNAMGQEL